MSVCVFACVYNVYMCVSVCLFVYLCVVCVYMHMHTHVVEFNIKLRS